MILHTAVPASTQRAAHGAVASRRLPLYLYGRVATQVAIDGPALKVLRHDKADNRYPLSRLSRIISGISVQWQAQALAACLENRIPIVFLDRAGQPTGYLHSVQHNPSPLDALIDELLDRPDGLAQYALWLRSERMRTLWAWRQASLAAGREIDPQQYRELMRLHVYLGQTPQTTGAHIYDSAIYAYALRQVHDAGARQVYWGLGGAPLELANDLANLLQLALALELQGLGAGMRGEDAALLEVLHTYGPMFAERCQTALARLHRRLRELLEEWH